MSDPTAKIAEQILADARKQAAPALRRAEREAAEIRRTAAEQAEHTAAEIIARADQKAEVAAQRMAARTELDVENARRAAREAILQDVRARARKALCRSTAEPDYAERLTGLAMAAVSAMTGGRFEIVLRAEDRDAFGADLAAELTRRAPAELGRWVQVSVAADTIEGAGGGLLVRSDDARQVCDETFAARMERLWEDLREDVAREVLPKADRAQ